MQHQRTDRERHRAVMGTIAALEERLRQLEAAERKRIQGEKIILSWETYDRITWGISDFIWEAVQSRAQSNLLEARGLWTKTSQNRACLICIISVLYADTAISVCLVYPLVDLLEWHISKDIQTSFCPQISPIVLEILYWETFSTAS